MFYLQYKAHNVPHFLGSLVVVTAMYSGFLYNGHGIVAT